MTRRELYGRNGCYSRPCSSTISLLATLVLVTFLATFAALVGATGRSVSRTRRIDGLGQTRVRLASSQNCSLANKRVPSPLLLTHGTSLRLLDAEEVAHAMVVKSALAVAVATALALVDNVRL